jgi:alpha/beta superfamily hydrolase
MRIINTTFHCGSLTLEGVAGLPRNVGHLAAVIICHPHPLYGGSMDNNVVNAIFNTLVKKNIVVFKFNFRGVGRSEGSFDDGRGEQDDVGAAITHVSLLEEVDVHRIGLVGYSAGATFGLPVACRDKRIKAVAAVSPGLAMTDFSFLTTYPKAKFLITGTEDDFTPLKQFTYFCEGLPPPVEYIKVEGVDHFWGGHEHEVAESLLVFFKRELKR